VREREEAARAGRVEERKRSSTFLFFFFSFPVFCWLTREQAKKNSVTHTMKQNAESLYVAMIPEIEN
jgi:hypothetical protein